MGSIYVGTQKVKKIYVGTQMVKKVYVGNTLVWSANETGYWLELLYKTGYISEAEFKKLESDCASIRVMLVSSIRTAKENM